MKVWYCCRTMRRGKWATVMAVAILYKNFMYFNYYGTAAMAKVHLSSNTLVLQCLLSSATYNNCFSHTGVPWKDLYFASVLAWRIPGTGEPGGLPSMGLHRVGHD